jgi:hypothetical protein
MPDNMPRPDSSTSNKPTDNAPTDDIQANDAGTGQQETTAAVPLEPTEADQGRASHSKAGMDSYSEQFAKQVTTALYPTRDDLVLQGRRAQSPQGPDEFQQRELGCIARAFDQALSDMDQVQAMRLLQWAIKTAEESHRRKCKTTRGRWWRWRFGQHMASMRRGQPEASGPP